MELFGQYVRRLRVQKKWTQEILADKLGVTKYQISHIEKGQRGAGPEVLEKLIKELDPTFKELEELQSICADENIGIYQPVDLRRIAPASKEMKRQKIFKDVHVVSARPIEITDMNEKNLFLFDMLDDLKKASRRNGSNPAPRNYIYWTIKSALPRFRVFLDFLEKNEISRKTIDNTFEFIFGPEELCLLSFAIYSTPVISKTKKESEYQRVGRILIRNDEDATSFDVIKMGDADLQRIFSFLIDKYDVLHISSGESNGYELLTAKDVRSY